MTRHAFRGRGRGRLLPSRPTSRRLATLILAFATLALACRPEAAVEKPHAGEEHDDRPATTPVRSARDEPGHGDHDHDDDPEGEGSDLDRPVAELLGETCEHGIPTHECAECRYEVGVAVAPGAGGEDSLVSIGRVERRLLQAPLLLTGEVALADDRTVHVTPRTPGTIRSVAVDLGSVVAAGDVLVEMDSREVAEARSEYVARRAERALALRTRSRERSLARQGVSAGQDRYLADAEAERAEIALRAARDRLLLLGVTEEEIDALDAGSIGGGEGLVALRAPQAGTVIHRHAALGEVVGPERELLVVTDLSVVWVWADVRGGDLAWILSVPPGERLPVEVATHGLPGRRFPGTLDYAGGEVDEETRVLRVRASVDNPGGLLRPGMFVEVRIATPAGGEAAVLPAEAVLRDEGRDFVFVRLEGDRFVRRPVIAGRTLRGWVEILEGPSPGTEVATAGAFLLKSDVLRSKMGAGCAD